MDVPAPTPPPESAAASSGLICPVSRLRPRSISWLWPGRLARGKLAILDGDPGPGKSLLALDLCARLSTGRPWPDDSPPVAAPAVYANGEDGDEDTLAPRLHGLGADPDRVFVLPRDPDTGRPLLELPGQTSVLEAIVDRVRPALVVIDPVTAFLGPGVSLALDTAVRRALAPLARLAERYGCAVLLIRHLNKRYGGRALYRGLGSIGLVGSCRHAWLLAADPKEPARRVLAEVKNNLGPRQPSLAFEVLDAAGPEPRVHWLGPVETGADDLLAPGKPRSEPRPPLHVFAREFLLDFLKAGPRTTREIWRQGQDLGLLERTLQRARRDLEVESVTAWGDGKKATYWLLPGQELPEGVTGPRMDPELAKMLREMNEQYPPPTPLDEDDGF